MLIDSHAHLDYEYDISIDELIKEAEAAGIESIISIAAAPDSLDRVVELAGKYPQVYHTSGIHPHDAQFWTPQIQAHVEKNANLERCVAIGELGLDYFYQHSNKQQQFRALEDQLALSVKLAKPIVLHTRDADEDTVSMLKQHSNAWDGAKNQNPRGVIHCFSGGRKLAEECLALGYYLSFSGIITFKNAEPLREVVRDVAPLNKILVETDSPYLAPVPHRGKKNHPAYTRFVAQKVADLKGLSLEELAKITSINTELLFRLSRCTSG